MRRALRLGGNLLVAASLLGLIGLGVLLLRPEEARPSTAVTSQGIRLPSSSVATVRGVRPQSNNPSTERPSGDTTAVLAPLAQSETVRPITNIHIPSIDLSAEVIPADLVPIDGGMTWKVPAFKVGHAEGTAGAGQAGNAVLLGHVTSLHSGNVFRDLERMRVGEDVEIFSGDEDALTYRVVSSVHVSRTNSDVLQATPWPSISLITCTGIWLPTIWDYTERLVVRAELAQ